MRAAVQHVIEKKGRKEISMTKTPFATKKYSQMGKAIKLERERERNKIFTFKAKTSLNTDGREVEGGQKRIRFIR